MIFDFLTEHALFRDIYIIIALLALERLIPRHRYHFNKKGLMEDLFYSVIFILVIPRLHSIFDQVFGAVRNLSPVEGPITFSSFHPVLGFLALLLIADFLLSATHFAMHRVQIMWKSHILHHSTTQLSLTSSFRVGIGEDICMVLFVMIPLTFMKFDPYLIQECFTVFGVHGYILHSNVSFKTPKALRFIACPHFHQWHHEKKLLRQGGQNFGITFTFWDMLLKTYYYPKEAPGDYGLSSDLELQGGWIAKYFYPLSTAKVMKRTPETDHTS